MEVKFGFKCENCNFRVRVLIGPHSSCPECGGKLVPSEESGDIMTNYSCPGCGTRFGMIFLPNTCPKCGRHIK